jgi:transketolase
MARTLRRWIIERSLAANVGHIGSALSIVDIVSALFSLMRDPGTSSSARDRLVLSKGHASLALYAALRWRGLIDQQTFETFCQDGSRLGVHPERGVPGIEVSTGSLGHGLSIGCGLAYGLQLREVPARVYVLMSDAECNEGQVWEAMMFAGHHRLGNVCAIVDLNGMQALGRTRDTLDLSPEAPLWRDMGWHVDEVDGHDPVALEVALAFDTGSQPRVVLARTRLGKGVSFMEDQLEWHYRNLTPELAARALRELSDQ